MTSRLSQQIQFILEIDRLKSILRQTHLADGSRLENSAEHSWHLALMALVLAEYAPTEVEPQRAIAMLLLHDLVEIDAGDTFCYDTAGNASKAAREAAAADRIFGLLPAEQGQTWQALWREFEAGTTATAQFANALDRLQPLLLNQQNQGGTWREHGIHEAQVWQRLAPIQAGAPALWPLVEQVVADCRAAGYLTPSS
ncbi:MAG: HD domain-containing protein [Spirulinaceae cyanobacterium SM2_1_0]|nr:HD domain-containing protein [Spirulinaceae cyanobacterium SM2_1_0]